MSEQVEEQPITQEQIEAYEKQKFEFIKKRLPNLRAEAEFSRLKTQILTDEVTQTRAFAMLAEMKADKPKENGDSKPSE